MLAILDKERENGTLKGVIVQFGGQTPLKLAHVIEQSGAPILGTSVDSIDLAEDRDRFKRLLDKLGLRQPKNGIAYSVEQARLVAADLGLPLVVRPSYVLGGRAMAIIHDDPALDDYLLGALPSLVPSDVKARYPNDKTGQINTVLGKNPLLFDRYLTDAVEIDVDALCDGRTVFVAGIMEHIEEAGIHSGDSACSLPPRSLKPDTIAQLEQQTKKLALALEVGGLMNVQYALKDGVIYVLEVNPRASRTVPFVAKVIGKPIAKIASRLMAGEQLELVRPRSRQARSCGRQGSGFPVRPLSRGGHGARPRDAIDRRGDGTRLDVRGRFRQESDRRRVPPAEIGDRVCLGARRRQGADRRAAQDAPGARLPNHRDRRDAALSRLARRSRPRRSTRSRRAARMRRTSSATAVCS